MTEMPGAIADEKNGIICELLHDLIAEYWTLQNTTFIENIGHCYNNIYVVFKLWKFVQTFIDGICVPLSPSIACGHFRSPIKQDFLAKARLATNYQRLASI